MRHLCLPIVVVALASAFAAGPGCRAADSTASPPAAEVTPAPPPPRDLLGEAATLVDGDVELRVNADVGRVVFFGRPGGTNLLNLDPSAQPRAYDSRQGRTWAGWGGDFVWVAFQSMWNRVFNGTKGGWPPDGVVDGGPWTLLVDAPDAIVMESDVTPELGVRLRRRFELLGDGEVLITNTLTREAASPFPVMIWTVTQTRGPDAMFMDLAPDRPTAGPRVVRWGPVKPGESWNDLADGRVVQYHRPPDKASKTGTLGRGLAAVLGNDLFLQRHAFDPLGAFPDAANVQIYVDDDDFVELELLSPEVQLAPGESRVHRVLWRLEPAPASGAPAAVAERLVAYIGAAEEQASK